MGKLSLPAVALARAIRFYRHLRWLYRQRHPEFEGVCRFSPTCSTYALEAIQVHGAARGSWLTLRRLARCGPWYQGSNHDPVPERKAA